MSLNHYYEAYGQVIGSDFPLLYLKNTSARQVDISFVRGKIDLDKVDFQSTKIRRKNLQAEIAFDNSKNPILKWEDLISFQCISKESKVIVDSSTEDSQVLSLFALSEALGIALFQKGYFLLHGSAIHLNGKSVLFLGEPGAGKSTTCAALALEGFPVMSDDLVCVEVKSALDIYVLPAFPQIKIWESSVNGLNIDKIHLNRTLEGVNKYSLESSITFETNNIPLGKTCFLSENTLEIMEYYELTEKEFAIELIKYFPLPSQLLSGRLLRDYFEKSILIAQNHQGINIFRQKNFETIKQFSRLLIEAIQ